MQLRHVSNPPPRSYRGPVLPGLYQLLCLRRASTSQLHQAPSSLPINCWRKRERGYFQTGKQMTIVRDEKKFIKKKQRLFWKELIVGCSKRLRFFLLAIHLISCQPKQYWAVKKSKFNEDALLSLIFGRGYRPPNSYFVEGMLKPLWITLMVISRTNEYLTTAITSTYWTIAAKESVVLEWVKNQHKFIRFTLQTAKMIVSLAQSEKVCLRMLRYLSSQSLT